MRLRTDRKNTMTHHQQRPVRHGHARRSTGLLASPDRATVRLMLRGELHNRGSAGRCEACGEIFPCPTGLAIYEAVKRELEHPTPPPPPSPTAATPPAIGQPPVLYSPKWEDLP